MTTAACDLPDDLATAHELIRELAKTVHTQGHLIAKLQHQLEQLLRHRFGRKSEKLDPAQLLLFAREILAELEPKPAEAEPPRRSRRHRRRPRRGPRPQAPAGEPAAQAGPPRPRPGTCSLPRLRHDAGRSARRSASSSSTCPASLIVLQHVRPKYACKACEGNVAIAERLPEPIEKGLPGPGLLAHVIVSKYADHLPLYRQERIFLRHGVELSRRTTCDWMAACGRAPGADLPGDAQAGPPVDGDRDRRHPGEGAGPGHRRDVHRAGSGTTSGTGPTRSSSTTTPPTAAPTARSGSWPTSAAASSRPTPTPATISSSPAGIVEVGCMAHARRKFDEAKTTDPARAHAAMAYIGRLYQIEREAKERIGEAIERLAEEGPLDAAQRRLREWRWPTRSRTSSARSNPSRWRRSSPSGSRRPRTRSCPRARSARRSPTRRRTGRR